MATGDKPMKKIGREECKLLRKVVESRLREALADFELNVDIGNMTFSGDTVSFKTTLAVADYNADVEDLKKYGWKYGLDETHFGSKFSSNGETYELVTIKPRSKKYPFIGRRLSDGKQYKFGRFILSEVLDK